METRNETTMSQKNKEQRSSTVKMVTEHILNSLERAEQAEERLLKAALQRVLKEKAEQANTNSQQNTKD